MKRHSILAALILFAAPALAQTYSVPPTSGPAANGSPGWHLAPSFPDPTGHTMVDDSGKVTVVRRERGTPDPIRATDDVPPCRGSIVCGRRGGFPRGQMLRVNWDTMPGWTPEYIYHLPPGLGGLPSVGLDSKGNLWAFQRRAPGQAQLMKFDTDRKLVLSVGDDVIGHQSKAHGLAVDADDNVWITDAGYSTVIKLSPEGKVLMTLGTRGKRGDWDEAKGQRLLWQPVMVAFGRNNDVYIAEGHANESPNDVGGPDPANTIGASRIIHLTRDGKFINQWFGDEVGQGKFDSAHGLAVDPTNGDVWIGDREQYRIVVYSGDGKFLRTMQMRNLVCAIHFDNEGNPWMGSGQDGQFLKLTRDGKVAGAIGNGMGIGPGQFTEASYFVFDKAGNLYAGDTSVGRVTVMRKPG
jgi:DNA-binding beta-propeller fold protein YncE